MAGRWWPPAPTHDKAQAGRWSGGLGLS